METPNIYLFKALDAYPYELEKAAEALNYALSYDSENVKALCLLGKLYSEQLNDYNTAKTYYERALASRLDIPEVYPEYIRVLLLNDDYDEVQKLIDFALTVKGIDTAGIYLAQGHLFESKNEFDSAVEAFKEAKQYAMNNDFTDYVSAELKRVRKKLKVEKKNAKKAVETIEIPKEKEATNTNWFRNRLNSLL
ncbi:tetratricopeptide repeat protein [Ulvibacter litoralis]|uniref:Tetratricopeptide repeat-containing protein n=1 Tax=Ulvibacter litoralis TaxID=227084 RepID=A0A1G7DIQ8_9FLAO|nr:tetratricopeptide repeat protein [Ulvibacter litoralis]GHC43270.1 hypothetical protein GCM10008083_02040 [Ulvibacter litoralis]SDE51412.1 Tetratricopeptide repeat-containing protein [Ulvibacter litoralis]